jgi:hypothetical protein
VDRFGQERPVVRTTLMYGANNPVDGAVLEVILRKAAKIREELGVPVPLPDEGHTLSQALLKAVMLRHREMNRQQVLPFERMAEARSLDAVWTDAKERAKQSRTIFAQRRLRPDDVLPEWRKTLAAVGGRDDVRRFTDRALARLGSGLEPYRKGGFKAPLAALPEDVRERLDVEGFAGSVSIDFDWPPAERCLPVQRSHPIVAVLAESLLERTLGAVPGTADPGVLGRVGCWVSDTVKARTTVAILRLRHRLVAQKGRRTSILLVEEAGAVAWGGASGDIVAEGEEALRLLSLPPAGDPPPHVRERNVAQALTLLDSRSTDLDALAQRRADTLLADHERVRESSKGRGSYEVHALLPPDIIGLYVLLPRVD